MKTPSPTNPLAGSELPRPDSHRFLGPVDPGMVIGVTVMVRHRPGSPPLPDLEDWRSTPPGQRRAVSHEEYARIYGADQPDLAKVRRFACAYGLNVTESHADRRAVALEGKAVQFEAAFGVTLNHYEGPLPTGRRRLGRQPGEASEIAYAPAPTQVHYGYDGPVHLPAELAGIVLAVIGLDNRSRGVAAGGNDPVGASASSVPNLAQRYNFPNPGASDQTIGVIAPQFSDAASPAWARSRIMHRSSAASGLEASRGSRVHRHWARLFGAAVVGAVLALVAALATSVPASAQGSAPGAPGANATWDEPSVMGFADSLGSSSKVWYTLGNGELENAFYPETDTPDTFGLQYAVTDGSTFTELETTGTTHAISLVNESSLVWQQVNTADNGDFTITKTYVADPSRSVILIQTTFDNTSSSALKLYVDYHPQLDNDGMGNTGGTDSASGDLVAENGSVASALAASTEFTQTDNGYVGSSSDGETMLTSSYALTSTYPQASTAGHIDQVAEIPVAASGSTTFTLALAFDTTEAAAISDASASLAAGFSSLESSFESGWQSWLSGLSAAPASVTGSASLKEQYYVSLMELKADEDKTYTGAFIAAPTVPWGASVSADSGAGQSGAHGYHAVWTRDEYEMATTLLAAGDKTDALAALNYIFSYEVESNGAVKQNTWLNGTPVFPSLQMDEVADPIILAWQLGDTGSSDWTSVQKLANYLVANGPYTPEERWEENAGYSPATMAAEIAGLICAASIAEDNDDPSAAETYQSTAQAWASEVDDLTYTTTGSYGNGDYMLRITPDGQPNAGTDILIANGGGYQPDRTVVDPSFLELIRLGVKSPTAADITNTISVVDSKLEVNTPEGPIWHRYNFDGYGETASGGDYTGVGVGNPWPVLTGERGEYDVADGNLSGAQSMLQTMAGAANAGYQISEQVWGGSTGTGGFAFGQPDNSSTPLMWAMAQYVRLAIDISAGKDIDTPSVVYDCLQQNSCPVTGTVKETVNVTVPVNTDASTDTVYLDGNLSALGYGASDWAANGIAMTRVSSDEWTTTVYATAGTTLSYKYDLGGNWNNVEETSSCGYVDNRSMSVNGGTQNDTVANWAGPGACGDSGAVINVTVPSGTPAGDTVYLSGNYDVLGTGIPSYLDWLAYDYPMIKTGTGTWTLTITGVPVANFQYKFTLGSWSNVEETSSCGYVNNRTFGFDTADATYTANDTVAAWQGVGSC